MTYEQVKWLDKVVICAGCGVFVALWRTATHDGVCPAKIHDNLISGEYDVLRKTDGERFEPHDHSPS